MSKRAAKVTQHEIEQAIRAAQKTKAGAVRIAPDGSITIEIAPLDAAQSPTKTNSDNQPSGRREPVSL